MGVEFLEVEGNCLEGGVVTYTTLMHFSKQAGTFHKANNGTPSAFDAGF